MNDSFNSILFWISFVGFVLFLVTSLNNTLSLKQSRGKEYPYSEFSLMIIYTVLAIIFSVMATSSFMFQPTDVLPPPNDLYIPIGTINLYNSQDIPYDTLEIFIKK